MAKYEFRLCTAVVDACTILSRGMTSDIARGLEVPDLAALLNRMFRDRDLLCFRESEPLILGGLFEHLRIGADLLGALAVLA